MDLMDRLKMPFTESGNERRLELINTATGETIVYEEFVDEDGNVTHHNGDARLADALNLLRQRKPTSLQDILDDEEIVETLSRAVADIIGVPYEEAHRSFFEHDAQAFGLHRRRGGQNPSTAGWKKRTLN